MSDGWSVKAVRVVRTVPDVVYAVSVNMVLTVTTWMARVLAHRAGKVPRVIDLVTPATTDQTVNTGENYTKCRSRNVSVCFSEMQTLCFHVSACRCLS